MRSMKTFRYPLGHEALKTATVGELRAALANYPADMPVLATWEGIYTAFRLDDDHFGEDDLKAYEGNWHDQDIEPCLVFDVDQY